MFLDAIGLSQAEFMTLYPDKVYITQLKDTEGE